MLISTVIDIAALAVKALPAEGLHIDGNPVAGFYPCHLTSSLFHDPHKFMAQYGARNSPGNCAVQDMDIAGADGGERNSHDGIPGGHDMWDWPFL